MSLAVDFFDLEEDFLEALACISGRALREQWPRYRQCSPSCSCWICSSWMRRWNLHLVASALDFLDFEVLAVEASPLAVSAVVLDFFDFELFVLVDVSAVEASAASAFLDLEDFLVVEPSAGAVESAVVDFLDFEDLVVVELSGVVAVSVVVLFFFFLAVVVDVSFGSVDCVVDCAAARKVRFPAIRKKADSNARDRVLRVRFMM